jgi:hypothetical protein
MGKVKIHVRTTVREDHQLKIKSLIKLVESGGKTRVKKVRLCDDNSVEKLIQ